MKIDRSALVSELHSFATRASGVLVGRPGVGKSYALRELCELFKQKGPRFLLLPVEFLGDVSDEEIRSYTNHSGDFITDLKKASDQPPGVLIFDGFDAARNEKARAKLLHLIRRCVIELRGKWHVLVSVRTYDAQKSEDLLQIFGKPIPGDNPRYRAEEFSCRHFVVPLLSDDELKLAFSNETLKPFADKLDEALRELLRIPFNIWLLEQVATDKLDDKSLTGVRSQVQLLSLFWRKRIQGRPDALSREAALGALVESMIRAHSLVALKSAVLKASDTSALAGLLSDDVLTEAGINRNQIGFSHNILFDYAVSVVALDEQPKELARFIAKDPATPFFLRPSFIYLLTALWYEKRELFWTHFWWRFPEELLSARLFSRLIPPGVLVSEAYREQDLAPLLNALEKEGNKVAPEARSVLHALRAIGPQRVELWASFAAKASKNPPADFVWDLTILGHDLLGQAGSSRDTEAVKNIGYIARNLLTWIWRNRKGSKQAAWDRLGGTFLVSMVARTFGTDASASLGVLAPVLDLPKEPAFPIEYLYRLSGEISHIWDSAPDFVGQLYDVVFAYDERSEEKTEMGSPVLRLTSTRRQDFNMCRWLLAEKFSDYLSAQPRQATAAGVRSLNAHVVAEHVLGHLKKGVSLSQVTKTFRFRGAHSTFIEDVSWIWDSSPRHDEPLRLADELFTFITKIPDHPNAGGLAKEVLDIFRDSAAVAFLWRRLLKAATMAPRFFGPLLYELTVAEPIQLGSETLVELTNFVVAAYPYLTRDQQIEFERTVLRLHQPHGSDSGRNEAILNRRNRLIGRLPKDLIATEEARQIHAQLVATSSVPANEPLSTITSWSRPYTTEVWLKDEGVDVDDKSNKAVLAEAKALHSFHDAWLNKRPTKDAISEILPRAQDFWAALSKRSDLPAKLNDYCWTSIGEAASAIARGVQEATDPAFEFAQRVLLAAAERLDTDEPGADDKEVSGWGPSAETAAASGLAWLLRLSPSKEGLEAFGRLIGNGSAPARYLAAMELRRIRRAAPHAFWELATQVATTEKNQSVVLALLHSVGADLRHDTNKVTSTIDVLVKRFSLGRDDTKLTEAFIDIAIWLYVAEQLAWSKQVLEQLIKQPIEFAHALRSATFAALRVVSLSYMKPDSRIYMDRSVAWLLTAIVAAGEGLDLLLRAANDKQDAAKIRALYGVLDEVVLRLYLGISREGSKQEELKDITPKDRLEFYAKVVPLLNQVIDTSSRGRISGLAAPTAHHFMELLNSVLEFNPRDSLHMARKVAVASESYGYNLDSLAIREVVKLVERVLVDFREIARDSLDDLLVLLDIFAKTGWPEAFRLIWRLDEAFR